MALHHYVTQAVRQVKPEVVGLVTYGTTGSSPVSVSITTLPRYPGNRLIVYVTANYTGTPVCTSVAAGTIEFTRATQIASGQVCASECWYSPPLTSSAPLLNSITLNHSLGGTIDFAVTVIEVKDIAAVPNPVRASSVWQASGNQVGLPTNTIGTSVKGAFLTAHYGWRADTTNFTTVDQGFMLRGQAKSGSSSTAGDGCAVCTITAAGGVSYTPTGNIDSARYCVSSLIEWIPGVSGGGKDIYVPPGTTVGIVQHASSSFVAPGSSVSVDFGVNPTVGTTMMALVMTANTGSYAASAVSGAGATWSRVQNINHGSGNQVMDVWLGQGVSSTSKTITTTLTQAGSNTVVILVELSGAHGTTPLSTTLPTNYGNGQTVSTTTLASTANKLFLAFLGSGATVNTFGGPTSGFTILNQNTNGVMGSVSATLLSKSQTSAGTESTSANSLTIANFVSVILYVNTA